jgi:hypothetical protein
METVLLAIGQAAELGLSATFCGECEMMTVPVYDGGGNTICPNCEDYVAAPGVIVIEEVVEEIIEDF